MSNVEMSKGLRDRLWKFFHFSYHHYAIRDLLVAIEEEGLIDESNDTDKLVVCRLWSAHQSLRDAAHHTFGKHFLAEMDKMNSLTTD